MAAGGVLVGRGYVSIRPEFEGDWSRSVNAHASSAGKSGAGAFSKAFGAGLKGLGALAGVAIGANLSSAAAGAAALAPSLATAGAAAGALKLGLSGVGDAFKAAFADTSSQANSAASATKAVESAQRGLANAQRALADARVQAAERVRDAQQQVADAERDLSDAQREARSVQGELNDARREAARALEDMNQRLAESHLDERDAVLRLKQAEAELKAAQQKPGVTPDELERLNISYERARLNLQEQRTETKRLATDTKKANKAGIEGSEQVMAVRERIADANRNVADKERALGEAQAGVDKARAEGARQIEDAQRAVADAASAVADAQSAAAAQTSKLDEAMSKLAPNARSFVDAVRGLAPAWTGMRMAVQNRLFEGLDSTVSTLGRTTIPVLQRQLTATADVWNHMAKSAAGAVTEMAKSGMLDKILAGATKNLAVFQDTPKQIITAFGQLTVAAQPAFNRLLTQFSAAIKSFTDGLSKSFESGGLQDAIDAAFSVLSSFGTLLGNVLGAVGQIFKAASDAGGAIVGSLGAVFGELKKILGGDEMQAQLRSLFASVAQIVGAIVPVIGSIVQAVVPLLSAIAAPVAQLATVLGPVLQHLATSLGAALLPIVQALGPVLVTVGAAIVQIVQSVIPLLQPIAALITGVITALAPALGPVVQLVTGLVNALTGPLTSVVQALTPVFERLGAIISQVFVAVQPFIAPLVSVIGQVAGLLAGLLAQAFKQLMQAIVPLLPVGIQLIRTVFSALVPVLPMLAHAFGSIAQAAGGVLGPIAGVVGQLAQSLAPVLAGIAPVLAEVAGLFAGALARALPPLAAVLVTLVQALDPLWPLLGQVVAQVVQLSAGVLSQLMPSLVQLLQATVQLAVAFLPLLPALTQIIGLVVQLGLGVVSQLLPPLVQLAGFLTGVLAGVLSTVIGWVASLVGWIADKLGPIFTWIGGVVTQVVGGILKIFRWFYDELIGHSILPDIVNYIRGPFASIFRWIRDSVIRPVMDGIKSAISLAWEKGIRPVFSALGLAVGKVADSFESARKAIKTAWDKLKGIAKAPIQYVVDVVYNNGIRGVWNKIAGAFGAPKLDKFSFASGGIMPGYTPGRDVHRFLSPTGGALELSGGEAIMRPEFTRAVGSGFIDTLNAIASSRGATGVKAALSPIFGGSAPMRTDRSSRFAAGGVVQRFADGGIFGWIKSAGSAIKGAGSDAWNAVKKGASWLADTLEASARAGVKHVVDPLLKSFPGMDTGIGKMIRRIPNKIIDALFGYSKKADGKGAGGIGGPRIAAGLKWAKTQAGKKYQWAGNGNPSWDCSGFMSAIESVIRGQKPHRRWATGAFSGKTAPPGWVYHGNSPFRIGITNAGVGHTAGTIAKTNVESRGGAGVVVGSKARGYNDSLFGSWYGFQPGKYDAGGWLGPGQAGVNQLRQPEAILTPSQWSTMSSLASQATTPITVQVHTRDKALADFIDVRVHRGNEELMAVIEAH